MHLSVVVLGNHPLIEELGKKATISDIVIYHQSRSGSVYSFIAPHSEKLQPLLESLHMGRVCVFSLSSLTKEIGEQLVLADAIGFDHGFFLLHHVPKDDLQRVIRGTSLERFAIVADSKELTERLDALSFSYTNDVWIPIDTAFMVKSVGTVALGFVHSGRVKKYDTLRVEPTGIEVTVKSIQVQDKDVSDAVSGTRVGLHLKGSTPDMLKRGVVLCSRAFILKEAVIELHSSRFYTTLIEPQEKLFFSVGLQVVSCTYDAAAKKVTLDAPVAYRAGERFLLVSQRDVLPRLIGYGTLTT